MFNVLEYRRLYDLAQRERGQGKLDEFWNVDMPQALRAHSGREFHLRDIFEAFVEGGREIVDTWRRNPAGGGYRGDRGLSISLARMEAGGVGAIDTSAFSRITGQIVFNEILDVWNAPEFLADQLVTTVPTMYLDGEKIPGISQLGDQAQDIGEGMPYPIAGLSEEFVETPATTKNGLIVPVTKEAIIADNTGRLLERARAVSESLRITKEKRVLDAVCGISTLYRRNGGALTATYVADVNWKYSNAFTDMDSVATLEALLHALTDPNTGEPIVISVRDFLVPKNLLRKVWRIINAIEVEVTTGSTTVTRSPNPLSVDIGTAIGPGGRVMSNEYVAQRTGSQTTWFAGDFQRAFAYMEVWPITSVAAGPNSQAEFERDIVEQYKASERGTPAVRDWRYAAKSVSEAAP